MKRKYARTIKVFLIVAAVSWAALLAFGEEEMTGIETDGPASPAAAGAPSEAPPAELTDSQKEAQKRIRGEDLKDLKEIASAETTVYHRIWAFFGAIILLFIAWLFSNNKKRIDYKIVFWGTAIQVALAVIILRTSFGKWLFGGIAAAVTRLLDFANAGADFVFGRWPDVMGVKDVLTGQEWVLGYNFAVKVLPTVIFVSSLFSVLYHLGVLQRVIDYIARGMMKIMKVSGAESLVAAGNIFMGMTASPLMIEPYVPKLTKSEFMLLMTSGMAGIGVSVMVAYIGMGIDATHILTASFISAPAAIVVSKLMVPEVEEPLTLGKTVKVEIRKSTNVFDAASLGATQGMTLAINIAATLIAFLALIALLNAMLAYMGQGLGFLVSNDAYSLDFLGFMLDEKGAVPLSLESILGVLGAPIALIIGIVPSEAIQVGQLIGIKTAANEFIAYSQLGVQMNTGAISARSAVLATYALCGFANFGSLAILLGGVGPLAPNRRGDMAKLGIRSIIGGSIASFLTATIAGMIM